MSCDRVGIALFGLGRAGSIHAPNVLANPRTKLLYVIEEDIDKATKFLDVHKADHVQVVSTKNAAVVFQDMAVQAVMICSPTATHEKFVMDSLKAGKAVFCEKPLSHNVESTAKCYEEANQRGLALLCSYNRRFDPGHASVIDEARKGNLGTIHSIITTSRDSPIPPLEFLKVSSGFIHDSGCHDIDMVLKIAGEAPSTVYAQAHSFVPSIAEINDIDCVAINLKFPSGIIATINIDRTSPYGYDQRLEVFGDKAMLISDNPKPTAVQLHNNNGVTLDKCHYSFPQRYAESYKGALDHFIDVIQGKAELKVTAQDAILATKVADACELSYKTQQVVDFTKF